VKRDPAWFGPPELGRGVVVGPGQPGPLGWLRHRIDEHTLSRPHDSVRLLHEHWLRRRPITVELALPASQLQLQSRQSDSRLPYELGCDFEFLGDRLHFLVWANNLDATGPDGPVWWLDRLAARFELTGRLTDGGPRDLLATGCLHRETLDLLRRGQFAGLRGPHRPGEVPPGGTTLPGWLAELTEPQRAAVLHGAGPARVVAPAGSGKTRVLTSRLRTLLSGWGVEPELVTAVTYNRRAREELTHRLRDLPTSPQVRTIHSLALAILRQQGEFTVISEMQARQLLAPLVPPGERRLNSDQLAPYLEALSRVRLALLPPEQVQAEREDIPDFSRVFRQYRARLQEQRLLDFDEQIFSAIEALCQHPELRADWQRRCRHLLVDEFQDLTPAFVLLLRLLAAPDYQVFGVGDDDQVIYGYSGANPEFLVDYERFFPHAASYDLGLNFRCPQEVVVAARRLLQRNRRRLRKTIEPGPHNLPGGLIWQEAPQEREAQAALEILRGWLAAGVPPEEIAVLARVNSILLPVHLGLHQLGIAHSCPLDATLLKRTGVRTALAYLRLACADEEFPALELTETLRRPNRRLRRQLLDQLSRRPCWTREALRRTATRWEEWEAEKLEDYLSQLQALGSLLHRQGVAPALRFLRTTVGLAGDLDELDRSSGGDPAGGHVDELLALEQAAHGCGNLAEFERLLAHGLQTPGDGGGISLSSVHRVKGQEWPRVLLYGVRMGLFPHRLAGPQGREEERRVFHVALTRARQEVVLLVDPGTPSCFVHELRPPARSVGSASASAAISGAVGQRVGHRLFGAGTITACQDGIATVTFDQGPARRIKLSYLEPA
jgi:DNA helicase-2/ATP-dependent DNA helicase PcrA